MDNILQRTPHYELTETAVNIDNKIVTTYGIKGNTVSFPDTSTDKSKVENMVMRLNREALEESQFMYFIQDELDK